MKQLTLDSGERVDATEANVQERADEIRARMSRDSFKEKKAFAATVKATYLADITEWEAAHSYAVKKSGRFTTSLDDVKALLTTKRETEQSLRPSELQALAVQWAANDKKDVGAEEEGEEAVPQVHFEEEDDDEEEESSSRKKHSKKDEEKTEGRRHVAPAKSQASHSERKTVTAKDNKSQRTTTAADSDERQGGPRAKSANSKKKRTTEESDNDESDEEVVAESRKSTGKGKKKDDEVVKEVEVVKGGRGRERDPKLRKAQAKEADEQEDDNDVVMGDVDDDDDEDTAKVQKAKQKAKATGAASRDKDTVVVKHKKSTTLKAAPATKSKSKAEPKSTKYVEDSDEMPKPTTKRKRSATVGDNDGEYSGTVRDPSTGKPLSYPVVVISKKPLRKKQADEDMYVDNERDEKDVAVESGEESFDDISDEEDEEDKRPKKKAKVDTVEKKKAAVAGASKKTPTKRAGAAGKKGKGLTLHEWCKLRTWTPTDPPCKSCKDAGVVCEKGSGGPVSKRKNSWKGCKRCILQKKQCSFNRAFALKANYDLSKPEQRAEWAALEKILFLLAHRAWNEEMETDEGGNLKIFGPEFERDKSAHYDYEELVRNLAPGIPLLLLEVLNLRKENRVLKQTIDKVESFVEAQATELDEQRAATDELQELVKKAASDQAAFNKLLAAKLQLGVEVGAKDSEKEASGQDATKSVAGAFSRKPDEPVTASTSNVIEHPVTASAKKVVETPVGASTANSTNKTSASAKKAASAAATTSSIPATDSISAKPRVSSSTRMSSRPSAASRKEEGELTEPSEASSQSSREVSPMRRESPTPVVPRKNLPTETDLFGGDNSILTALESDSDLPQAPKPSSRKAPAKGSKAASKTATKANKQQPPVAGPSRRNTRSNTVQPAEDSEEEELDISIAPAKVHTRSKGRA